MAELFPPGTTLRSSKEALDVEIFGHAPGALDGEDAYVCTFIRDGEDAGEDLMPVSRAHDEAEFARVEPPASSPAAEPEEEWWPDGASGGGGARNPPSGAAEDDAPGNSPFRESTSEVPREDDAPTKRGKPDAWGNPDPSPAFPASPRSPPPHRKPRREPARGRGDDAFDPGARLRDANAEPTVKPNFVVEVVSYHPRKDEYGCVFRDGRGKKLDEGVVKGSRLHDPSAFRQIGAGRRRVSGTDGVKSKTRRKSTRSSSDGRSTRNGRNGRVVPAPAGRDALGTSGNGRRPARGQTGRDATGGGFYPNSRDRALAATPTMDRHRVKSPSRPARIAR
jgi:hypothetical protein